MKKVLIGILFLTAPSLSMAGSQTGSIKELVAHDDGNGIQKVDVELEGQTTSMEWCSSRQQWAFILDNDLAKAQFSMLLAAYSSNRPVTIDSDGGKVCVYGNRNRVRNVRLK